MSANHTPGPWHWHDLRDDWAISGLDGTTSVIAPDQKPTTANAHLIASAPELLKALENAEQALAFWEKMGTNVDCAPWAALTIARAAVVKAKGDAP